MIKGLNTNGYAQSDNIARPKNKQLTNTDCPSCDWKLGGE